MPRRTRLVSKNNLYTSSNNVLSSKHFSEALKITKEPRICGGDNVEQNTVLEEVNEKRLLLFASISLCIFVVFKELHT